jgi:hypothetical protein
MKSTQLIQGHDYAFRPSARSQCPLIRVKLLDAQPVAAKVGVRFESGDREGEEGLVTLGQLIVPWEKAARLEADEDAFKRLAEAVPERDLVNQPSVEFACQLFAGPKAVHGVLGGIRFGPEMLDLLAAQAGLEAEHLASGELAFTTIDDEQVIPIRPAEELARALVASAPATVAETIIDWQGRSQASYYGPVFRTVREWAQVPDAPSAEDVAETEQVRRAALDAIERFEELAREAQEQADALRKKLGLS